MKTGAKRKESWLGVVLTALVCGAFLWWWMTPEPEPPSDVRDAELWLDDAARQIAGSARRIELDYDLLFLARLWRADGVESAAARAAGLIASPALREVATAELPLPEPPSPQTSAANDPIGSRLSEARSAFDQLEFTRGRECLDDAERLAEGRADTPGKVNALARVAAARYQLGDNEPARALMKRISSGFPNKITELSAEVIRQFAATDVPGPCLEWLAGRPPESAEAREVARELARTIDDRVHHRETGELAVHGAAADPGALPDPERQHRAKVWSLVEANDVSAISRLRASAPAATEAGPDESSARTALAVSRALLWHRTPRAPAF